jgi:hypothetical protein
MQQGEWLCQNPSCRRPLNSYPFARQIGTRVYLYCAASCFGRYEREQRRRAYTASVLQAASSSGASHEGQAEAKADQRARSALTLATAFASGIVLAIGALA